MKQFSRDQLIHYIAMDVGKTEILAGVAVGEPRVVEAHQAQDSGVKIMDVDGLLHCPKAKFIGGPVHVAALDPAAGHPHRESVMIVIAAVKLSGV